MTKYKALIFLVLFGCLAACSTTKDSMEEELPSYTPESKELHSEVAKLDSILFDAYNQCKVEVFESLVSEDIEFYHDRSGLSKSKKQLIDALRNNICGKVKRELLAGSIEVYPIPGYGAVQMGAHRFYELQSSDQGPSRFAKFVHTWKNEDGNWKLTRVISLH